MESDILIFEIEGRRFGVRAALVTEVVRAVTPMPLPGSPSVVMGMINLRGCALPVLKTRQLLNLPHVEVRHTDHLLVLGDGELAYAIHVDRAVDLVRLKIEAKAEDASGQSSDANRIGLVAGDAGGLTQVIETADLLGVQERADLLAIVSSQSVTEIPM